MKHALITDVEGKFKPDNIVYVWVGRDPVVEGEVKSPPAMVEIHFDKYNGGDRIETVYVDLKLSEDGSFFINMYTRSGKDRTILCTSDPLPVKPLTCVSGNSRYTEYAAFIIEAEIKWMFANYLLPIIFRDEDDNIQIVDAGGVQNLDFQHENMTCDIVHELVHVFGGVGEDISETSRRGRI